MQSSQARHLEPFAVPAGACVGAGHQNHRGGYWTGRPGQYRVAYSIPEDEILVRVVRISHRASLTARTVDACVCVVSPLGTLIGPDISACKGKA